MIRAAPGFDRSVWDRRLASHDNGLDAARLVFAAMVLVGHAFYLATDSPVNDPLYRLSGGQFTLGRLGVDLFFVLSGILITRSWIVSSTWRSYLLKRVARIYPGFVCASLACLALVAIVESSAVVRPDLTLANMIALKPTGLQGFLDNPMAGVVDGAAWTIKYEFECYLIVLVLGVAGGLNRYSALAILCASLMALAAQELGLLSLPAWDHGPISFLASGPRMWPRLWSLFFAGAAFYLWRNHIPANRWLLGGMCLGLIAAVGVGVGQFALPLVAPYLMLWIGLLKVPALKIGGQRIDLSYGIYLYHFPVQQALIASLPPSPDPALILALSIAPTVILACLSWRLVERPALEFAHAAKQSWVAKAG